jgi:hypothetical protein
MHNTWTFWGPRRTERKYATQLIRSRDRVAQISFSFVTSPFFRLSRRLTLSLGLSHSAQFGFAHRLIHAFGRTSERRLLAFASLGSQRGARSHLLFL